MFHCPLPTGLRGLYTWSTVFGGYCLVEMRQCMKLMEVVGSQLLFTKLGRSSKGTGELYVVSVSPNVADRGVWVSSMSTGSVVRGGFCKTMQACILWPSSTLSWSTFSVTVKKSRDRKRMKLFTRDTPHTTDNNHEYYKRLPSSSLIRMWDTWYLWKPPKLLIAGGISVNETCCWLSNTWSFVISTRSSDG